MFSGIVEKTVKLIQIEISGTNKIFTLENPYGEDIYIDESISHDGVCLTVIAYDLNTYKVEAILETLTVSNLDNWKVGDKINLERCVKATTRMDGHMVQGHVDTIGIVQEIVDKEGSWEITVEIPEKYNNLVIHKGSICLNGISLTIKRLEGNCVTVAIIPYTFDNTNIHNWKIGSEINIEFDMIGKYIVSYLDKYNIK